jgi:hypothetical protein
MRINRRPVLALCLALLSAMAHPAVAQSTSHQHDHGDGNAYPGVGDLMNALIQPRHAKLGLAGAEKNWPLAAYVLHELRQSFDKVGTLRPTWNGLSLPYMFESTVGDPLNAIDRAINAQDPEEFKKGYARLTAACNLCHTAAQHPFIVIKVPDRSEFPNQDFRAQQP